MCEGLRLNGDAETILRPVDKRIGLQEVDVGRDEARFENTADFAERRQEGGDFEVTACLVKTQLHET